MRHRQGGVLRHAISIHFTQSAPGSLPASNASVTSARKSWKPSPPSRSWNSVTAPRAGYQPRRARREGPPEASCPHPVQPMCSQLSSPHTQTVTPRPTLGGGGGDPPTRPGPGRKGAFTSRTFLKIIHFIVYEARNRSVHKRSCPTGPTPSHGQLARVYLAQIEIFKLAISPRGIL
jgi:hypothetical protein